MIALFLNFSSAIGAQTQLVDSLIKVLNTQKLTPDEQLELYDDIFINTLNSDIEKSLIYAEKGLVLAATEKNKGMISIFNARLGLVYAHKKKYDQAIIYFEKSLRKSNEF
jgi:tetratricopeptide (TPR) repeat protein